MLSGGEGQCDEQVEEGGGDREASVLREPPKIAAPLTLPPPRLRVGSKRHTFQGAVDTCDGFMCGNRESEGDALGEKEAPWFPSVLNIQLHLHLKRWIC